MRILKRKYIYRLKIAAIFTGILSLFFLGAWIPAQRYQERLLIFRDTLGRNHNFNPVKVSWDGMVLAHAQGISNYSIDLFGAVESRTVCSAYAKCFANHVLKPSPFYADTIYINYCSGDTVIRQYAFLDSDFSN